MIHWAYNFFWFSAYPLLYAGQGFFPKKWDVPHRLRAPSASKRPRVWFHCASLGEAKGLLGFLDGFKYLHGELLITTSTVAGKTFLEETAPAILSQPPVISIAPLDHAACIIGFINAHRVKCLVLYEMELWPNTLSICGKRKIPVLWVGARFSPRAQKLYGIFPHALRFALQNITWIQSRGPADRRRLQPYTELSVETGTDYKFIYFQHHSVYVMASRLRRDNGFAFVSLHLKELRILLPLISSIGLKRKIIIFPRKLSEVKAFYRVLRPLGFDLASRNPASHHLLVDLYGKIPAYLSFCRACFVGGSLVQKGAHNFWEPFVLGVFTYFGPHYYNQRDLGKFLCAHGMGEKISFPEDIDPDTSIEPIQWSAALADYARQTKTATARAFEVLRNCVGEKASRSNAKGKALTH